MIFDFVLVKKYSGQTIDKSYCIEKQVTHLPLYSEAACNKFSFFSDEYFYSGFSRGDNSESIYSSGQLSVIIIGECFSRYDSTEFSGQSRLVKASELFKLYEIYSEEFLKHIKGNFQIVIMNGDKVSLFNSKSGVSPFYYYKENESVILTTAVYLIPDSFKSNLRFKTSHILEYAVFNYPLGEHTLFDKVKQVLPGYYYSFSEEIIEKTCYYNINNLINSDRLTEEEAIEKGLSLFKKCVVDYMSDKEKYCLSLTGGFDGRAILSASETDASNLLLYSFGIKGSKNIDIPMKMAKELKLNYKPYFLEEDYQDNYPLYSYHTCISTDCQATIQRANYVYVFRDLSRFSNTVITGIFGSEFMRAFQNIGAQVSSSLFSLVEGDDNISRETVKEKLRSIIKNYKYKNYWGEQIFTEENSEQLVSSFIQQFYSEEFKDSNYFFYNYYFKEGVRKYFGGEVHSERLFATNRFPFYDDEFIEIILRSPFSSINKKLLNPAVKEKFSSQIYYALLIKKYNEKLLDYDTDHGFAPKYLLYSFPFFFIAPQYILKSLLRRFSGYKEFRPEKWAAEMITKNYHILSGDSFLNREAVKNAFDSGKWVEIMEEYRKMFSVLLYTNIYKS